MSPTAQRLQNWPLAITLIGGVGLVITFLSPIFTLGVRWALILALLLVTLPRPRALGWLRTPTGGFVVGSMSWSLLSYFWSGQPLLTFMKAAAFILVVLALTSAGYRWLKVNGVQAALSFLFPLMVAALLAGVIGRTDERAFSPGPGMDLYRGLTDNSNMFGSLMFMVSPLILWNLHRGRRRPATRLIWGGLLAAVFVMLLLSVSRSSILAFLAMLGCYGLSLPIARRTSILFFVILAAATGLLMWPGTWGGLEARYVRKNLQDQNSSIILSRQTPWQISWEMAQQGGWFGAGYGVSIGAGSFAGGLTTVGYGREKGNTQLAIVEETGIVGLALHLLIAGSALRLVWRAFRGARDPDLRALVAIVMGALLGAFFIGIFEAWWVAPGAPESVWFWSIVGVALAVGEVVKSRQETHSRRPAGTPDRPCP
jgi:O-antigen ligase